MKSLKELKVLKSGLHILRVNPQYQASRINNGTQ